MRKSIYIIAILTIIIPSLKAQIQAEIDGHTSIHGNLSIQALKKIFPDLVSVNEEGTHALNYDGLGVLAIQAIKEQQALIETLQDQLIKQRQRIEALEKAVE